MQASISKILKTVSRSMLALTLYDKMLSSRDFQDVKEALNDRTDWSIELVSSSVHFVFQHLSPFTNHCSFAAASRTGRLPSLHGYSG